MSGLPGGGGVAPARVGRSAGAPSAPYVRVGPGTSPPVRVSSGAAGGAGFGVDAEPGGWSMGVEYSGAAGRAQGGDVAPAE